MKKKDIIELYRNQVESRKESPPETSWDEISTQLEIEEAWNSIYSELDRVLPADIGSATIQVGNQGSFIKLISTVSTAALIILLLTLSDIREINIISPEIPGIEIPVISSSQTAASRKINMVPVNPEKKGEEQEVFSEVEPARQSIKKVNNNLISEPPPFYIVERVTLGVSAEQTTGTEITTDRVNPGLETASISTQQFLSPFVTPAAPLNRSKLNLGTVLPSSLTSLTGYSEETGSEQGLNGSFPKGKRLNLNKFSVGVSITEKNTWLISQETFDGFDKQKLNTSQIKFLNDFGIILRYTSNERWSFEGSGFIISKTGQAYRQYLHGVYSVKSYDLRYTSFEMSARYSLHRSLNFDNVKFYSVAGAYISHLSSAYKIINKQKYDVSSDYNPFDYGVIAGYEVEILILDRVALAPGFRIKFGIPNIFSDQPDIPKELHATRNASLEFRLNLTLPFKNF